MLLGVGLIAAVLASQAVTPCRQLASFTESDVAVDVSLELDKVNTGWLVARFTPTREGYHLYSKDLSPGGLGFPTLLKIVSGRGVAASGELSADRDEASLYIEPLRTTLNVYPDGPVTMRLPVTISPAPALVSADVSVTYDACSASNCLRPVIDKRFSVACVMAGGEQ